MKNKLYILVAFCLFTDLKTTNDPMTFDFGGLHINPETTVKLVTGAVQVAQDIAQRKRDTIEQQIANINQERSILGLQKDQKIIGDAHYEQQLKALDQKAERLERLLKNSEHNGDKAAETVQNVMLSGWQTFLDVQKDEATRKTQIAVAGVTKAVENEGALQRLEFATKQMTEPQTLMRIGSFIVLSSGGIVGGYYGLKLLAHYIQAHMNLPTLVRESSRKSALGYWIQSVQEKFFKASLQPEILDEIVLNNEIEKQIKDLAQDVRSSYVTGLPFRNLLLYGPAGTGKTMIAKLLARFSDMDYALISGADFSQFAEGNDVEQLHKLLDWANKSERGLVLFIDEVDALAMNRKTPGLDQRWIKLQNALLSRTGELSEKFMIIGATNHKENLDDAFLSRMHKHLYIGLPEKGERVKLLKQYLEKYIAHDTRNILVNQKRVAAKLTIDEGVNEEYLSHVALKINGFSGRDIAFMIDELRAVCYRSPALTLTKEIFSLVVEQTIKNRQMKH